MGVEWLLERGLKCVKEGRVETLSVLVVVVVVVVDYVLNWGAWCLC